MGPAHPAARPAAGASAPLLPRIAAGDRDAVRACLDRYAPLVLAMARRWLRDEMRAEDAVQEIFIRVWRTAARYDPRQGSERTWIATITRRALIDESRRRGAAAPHEPLEDDVAGETGSGLEQAARSEEAAAVRQAIDELPADRRRLLTLSLLHGRSHSEIASETGQPLGTVKTQLRRSLERLRARLASAGGPTVREVTP